MLPKPVSMSKLYAAESRAKDRPKGERRRFLLLAATCIVLDSKGFAEMGVADICKHAKASRALFYHYFEDKGAAAREAIRELLQRSFEQYSSMHRQEDAYHSILETTLYYVLLFERNLGLLRALASRAPELAQLDAVLAEYSQRWNARMARSIKGPFGGCPIGEQDRTLVSYALGGMMDELMRQLWINRNPDVKMATRDVFQLAETMSIVSYRATKGADPTRKSVERARRQVELSLKTWSDRAGR